MTVIFINGSFGVGKTTVSRLLVERLPRSILFDPEPVGLLLSRARAVLFPPLVDDFQDLHAWRRTSIRLIQLVSRFRATVVVPMAFSNVSYLNEFLTGARARGRRVLHFCLTAPPATVRVRLSQRAPRHGPTAWQLRRSQECCQVHSRPEFAEHIATEERSPQQVADEILRRIHARIAAPSS